MRSPTPRFPRLRSAALRLVALGRRAVDLFPFTPLGLVTLGAAAFALTRYGVRRVDLLYLVIGAAGLGLGALGLLLTTLTAVGIRLGMRRAPADAKVLRLACGERTTTGFSLPALGYVPMIHVRWSWTSPEATVRAEKVRGRLVEEVTPARRGLLAGIERRVEVSDAFALTRIAFVHREPRAVRAVPSTGALDRLRLSRSIAGGDDIYDPEGPPDGERVDLRGYTAGDPIRFVLWKVYAKSRQLVVRTPERALSPARRTLAYLVTGRGDEAAAGVARKAVEGGVLGADFALGADGAPADARTVEDALEILARSAQEVVPAGRGGGLAAFLSRAPQGARAILFVPAFDGPWVPRIVGELRGRPRMQIVVCADGLDRGRAPSLLRRLLVGKAKIRAGERPRARDVEVLMSKLAVTGAEMVLVDRLHGGVYVGASLGARVAAPSRERRAAATAPEHA